MIDPIEVRKRIRATVLPTSYDFEPTRGQKGAIVGTLNKTFGRDALRYLVCAWLFTDDLTPKRSKDLTNQEWFALLNWIEFGKVDGETVVGELFHDEHVAVLNAALKAFAEADWSVQYLYDIDPLEYAVTALSLGGEIVEAKEDATTSVTPIGEKQAPPILASSGFRGEKQSARLERERQLLKELGYDVEDDPGSLF